MMAPLIGKRRICDPKQKNPKSPVPLILYYQGIISALCGSQWVTNVWEEKYSRSTLSDSQEFTPL